MKHLTALTVLLLACGGSGAAPVRIETPDGFSFVVPDGFSHEVHQQGGTTRHDLKGPPGEIAIAPFQYTSDSLPTCGEALTTRFGLAGCFGASAVNDASAGIAILHSGTVGVLVVGSARGPGASQLVRDFIETVEVRARPAGGRAQSAGPSTAIDPQFFGCFTSGSYSDTSSFGMTTGYSLCLRKDFSFEYAWQVVGTSFDLGGDPTHSADGNEVEHGRWSAEPSPPGQRTTWKLHLVFSDGSRQTWDVQFWRGYLVRGEDDIWERRN